MALKNSLSEYGVLAKFFHWTLFILIVIMLIVGFVMSDITNKFLKYEIVNLHKLLGLIILVLMTLRLAWAMSNPKPLLTTFWEKTVAKIVHQSLYILLILMPLTGWIMSTAHGKPPTWLGWKIKLPLQTNQNVAQLFATYHNKLAIMIILLLSLHILAALYHHIIKKDHILRRMLP